MNSLPEKVLTRIFWSFAGGQFADRQEFNEAVHEYQLQIAGESRWQPDEVVVPVREIRVRYFGAEEDSIVEVVGGQGELTASEILFQLHNRLVEELSDIEHHFFEGLALSSEVEGAPTYELQQGS